MPAGGDATGGGRIDHRPGGDVGAVTVYEVRGGAGLSIGRGQGRLGQLSRAGLRVADCDVVHRSAPVLVTVERVGDRVAGVR